MAYEYHKDLAGADLHAPAAHNQNASTIESGTFGTGAYVFDNTVSGITDLTVSGSITDGTYTSDGSGNFSGVGTIGCGAITSTGDITSTKNGAALTLDVMKFSDYASQCVFEKTAAGTGYWHFGTLDARTVARTNNLFIWGLGAVDAATNYERMVIGFTTTDTDRFKIGTSADGTGSVRPLELLTGTNTGQLYLNTDGSIDMAGALGCGAITSTEESPTLTLADNRSLSAPDWNDAIIGDIDFYTSDGSGGGAGAVSRIRSVVDVDGTNDPNAGMSFWTGPTSDFAERVRISSAGYVGIDTTDPISPLEIRGAADVPPLTIRCPHATDSYTGIIFSTYVGTADNKKGGIFFKRDGDDGSMRGDMIFALNNEASAANVDDGDAIMTILREGNVGIGTLNPTEKLHIYESIATKNVKFDSMFIETYSSTGAPYGYGSSTGAGFGTGITFRGRTFNSATIRDLARVGYYIQDNSTDTTYGTAMVFDTINTASGALVEAMRIDYKGDIGIGLVDPDSKLEVAGSFKATGATSGTNLGGSIEIEDAVAANAGDVKIAGGTSIDPNDSGHVYIDGGNGPNEGNILLCTAYGLVGIGPAVNPTQPLEVNGNAQVNGEMMGTKQILQFSREDANDVYGTVATFTDYSSVRTTTAKGFTAMRAGSVTGISINYDITAEVLDSSTAIQVFVNGVSVWQNTLTGSGTIASNQEEYFTQARDTDTFSAGDTITVVLFGIGAGGTNATFDNTIIALELYSDA